jgi:hypothetical protein
VRTGDVVVKIEKESTEHAMLSHTRPAITLTQR